MNVKEEALRYLWYGDVVRCKADKQEYIVIRNESRGGWNPLVVRLNEIKDRHEWDLVYKAIHEATDTKYPSTPICHGSIVKWRYEKNAYIVVGHYNDSTQAVKLEELFSMPDSNWKLRFEVELKKYEGE